MADVVKGLTHLAVNQAFVSSSLIIRPRKLKLPGNPGFFTYKKSTALRDANLTKLLISGALM